MADRYGKEVVEVKTAYAMANKKADIGDIVQIEYGDIIIVEKIQMPMFYHGDLPCVVYIGTMMTKKLEPYKSGKRDGFSDDRITVLKRKDQTA